MSEHRLLNIEEIKARDERTRQRRAELAPALAQVTSLGINVYEQLRPRAQHVQEVARDFPLRHQQVHGMGVGGPSGVVADYLMVAFGNDHDLLLHRDYGSESSPWKFERSFLAGFAGLATVRTELKVVAPRYQSSIGVHEIEVSRYKYPERVGVNARHDEFLCSYLNDYKNAESYLTAMEADLSRALSDNL